MGSASTRCLCNASLEMNCFEVVVYSNERDNVNLRSSNFELETTVAQKGQDKHKSPNTTCKPRQAEKKVGE